MGRVLGSIDLTSSFSVMTMGLKAALFLVSGVTLLGHLSCLGKTLEDNRPMHPHLIFIMVDDQGYGDIGYHGSDIHTPVLDQLAREGVILENYYVQPICSPSRSQLMTGRYQIHTGLQHSIIRPRQPLCLPLDIPTLPERLREAGYATHMVGKWHLGFCKQSCLPTGRGFQSFLGTLTGSGDHFSYQSCDGAEACGFDLHEGNKPAWEKSGNYSTFLYIKRAKEILRNHDGHKPLFLYLSLQAAHTPLQVPEHYLHHYDSQSNRVRRHYSAMLSCLDNGVGEVIQELKNSGLYKNSVLIYSSDNGGQPLSGASNWPLRGGKGTYWEGGIRAVGFVHSPLLTSKGVVNHALIHVSDWFPTLLGLAGAPQDQHFVDGYDVWKTISKGIPSPRHEILYNIDPVSRRPEEPYNKALLENGFGIWDTGVKAAIRAGDWKLLTGNMGNGDWIPPHYFPSPAKQGLEKRRNELGKSVWLFNIRNDPYERSDQAETHPDIVKHLLRRLSEYNQTAVVAQNPPDDPLADPELHGGVWGPWLDVGVSHEVTTYHKQGRENRPYQQSTINKVKQCRVCKLKALFKKVGSRLQRNMLFY